MATSFEKNIKPYFSESDKDAMMNPDHTGGFTLDLWGRDDVEQNFSLIQGAIDSRSMPPGGWADDQIKAFDTDFEAWQAGGYQP
jgi:hypothetical protein